MNSATAPLSEGSRYLTWRYTILLMKNQLIMFCIHRLPLLAWAKPEKKMDGKDYLHLNVLLHDCLIPGALC